MTLAPSRDRDVVSHRKSACIIVNIWNIYFKFAQKCREISSLSVYIARFLEFKGKDMWPTQKRKWTVVLGLPQWRLSEHSECSLFFGTSPDFATCIDKKNDDCTYSEFSQEQFKIKIKSIAQLLTKLWRVLHGHVKIYPNMAQGKLGPSANMAQIPTLRVTTVSQTIYYIFIVSYNDNTLLVICLSWNTLKCREKTHYLTTLREQTL